MDRKKIAITTGDVDGIGPEVTFKALSKIGPDPNYQYFVFRSKMDSLFNQLNLREKFNSVEVSTVQEALHNTNHDLVIITSEHSPARWVEVAAESCKANLCDAMVTGPLSKTEIVNSGYTEIGHTEILKRISGSGPVYMTFLGEYFNVLLLTSHIPLRLVPNHVNKVNIQESIKTAQVVVNSLGEKKKNLPIGFIGLNPHSGEHGLIGMEEMQIIKPTIEQMKYNGANIEGPLVPDAAFLKKNWEKYSMYISPYHDQGLTAFKIVHGHDSGVHITFGLPFIRTSVNHGTAKDIFGKDLANPNSMIDSIYWAKKLIDSNIKQIDKLKNILGEDHENGSSDISRI